MKKNIVMKTTFIKDFMQQLGHTNATGTTYNYEWEWKVE